MKDSFSPERVADGGEEGGTNRQGQAKSALRLAQEWRALPLRRWPWTAWLMSSGLAAAMLLLAGIFLVGRGQFPRVASLLWGPAAGWMILGGLTFSWYRGAGLEAFRARTALAFLAGLLFLLAPVRLWQETAKVREANGQLPFGVATGAAPSEVAVTNEALRLRSEGSRKP